MYKLLISLSIAGALNNTILAQEKTKYMPPAAKVNVNKLSSYFQTAENDPLNARIYTLKNGLKIYLSVYKNAPRIQTYIAVKAGSKNDPSNATGLAHYLEHMVFKGTDKYGTKDFAKESIEIGKIENLYEVYRNTSDEKKRKEIYHQIDSISGVAAKYAIANEYDKMLAGIGASGTNAFTSFDQTVYVNEIPSNQITNWLKIEAERFRKPVLRLFHTELEAVYEEKNRGLDNDDSKVWEAINEGLFAKHTYGTQTTIGTIEHLKNPSMVEINKYYNKHYVPNNMAIIMSGDFEPEKVVAEIEKYFGGFESKAVEPYKFENEAPIVQKIKKEIYGPNPENVNLAWRFAGDGSNDADMCTLLAGVLYNGTAGLMDLNLNQAQKLLTSYDYFYALKDYSMLLFGGEPKEGQSLEEVEQLLLAEINRVKKGDFPDWLMNAVITDLKLKKTKELENNGSRADAMLTAFTNDINWQNYVNTIERISKITKQQLIDFANKNFSENNYVVVYKRIGEDKNILKVEKPTITPVDVDRENTSEFVKNIGNSLPASIEPRFLDYEKDITKTTVNANVPLLYNQNTENNLFELYYKFNMGSINNKTLPVAIKYIPYLGTAGTSAAQVKQELYKLGCSFNVFSDMENTWVSLTGLSENFDKALELFERILSKPVVEDDVLKNLIGDMIKERNDNKLQKRLILNRAMVNYARYGAVNPFSFVLSDEELNKVNASSIKDLISKLTSYEHKILYYGPKNINELTATLKTNHKTPTKLNSPPAAQKFVERELDKTVYLVDYDMTQAEIIMLSNGNNYNVNEVPIITLYNNYFGGGMSSILFQDLRESKALAYYTYSRYNQPNKLWKKYYNLSYIGSQADKLGEALKGLSDLLNEMPKAEASFAAAKESIIQEMRTQRITKSEVLFNFIESEELGVKSDIRKDVFSKVQTFTFDDINKFHAQTIKGKACTVLVLGKKDNLDKKVLEKYGTVKVLSLKEIFGY